MRTRVAAIGVPALRASAGPCGLAHADETHTDSHYAPVVVLVSTGQIDDPFEDVLEHAAVLGTTYVYD
ncbi:hypothetical protein SSP531S_27470 [Streptomyces spongiicola]|uniref:Uncharacterized protein n=1 Tax=Streptomyces spongiicola TaxID=1690221 RepID=A0A388SZ71_9ACTN|nr:hypothetical protein [Streptomyces spongiicola]GBQ01314.1 hypothetical protein SSP531S_27470 [Streptomyces spongiicola]